MRRRGNFIVLDQNCMRDRAQIMSLFRECQLQSAALALPATAFGEMLKTPEWRSTIARSLELIALSPGHVVGLRTTRDLLREEAETGEMAREIVDLAWTQRLRDVLVGVARGNLEVLDRWEGHGGRIEEDSPTYNPANSLVRYVEGQDLLRTLLQPRQVKALRKRDFTSLVDALGTATGNTLAARALTGVYGEDVAERLVATSSFSVAHVFAHLIRHLDWVSDGSPRNQDARAVRNDHLDVSYYLFAVFGRRVATKEDRVQRRHELLARILERREIYLARDTW